MNEERGRELGVGLLGFQPLLYISVRPSLCLIDQLSLSHISLHQPDPHPSPTHPTIIFTLLFFIVSFFFSPSLLIFFAFLRRVVLSPCCTNQTGRGDRSAGQSKRAVLMNRITQSSCSGFFFSWPQLHFQGQLVSHGKLDR